ncbi:MAG: TolC family protein [Bacillota bacterium]
MSSLKKSRLVFFLALACLLFLFSGIIRAEEMFNLKEALQSGVENSSVLEDARSEIESIEREIFRTEAGRDWNLDLSSSYNYDSDPGTDFGAPLPHNTLRMGLSSHKKYRGFDLSPSLNISGIEADDFSDISNLEDKTDLGFKVSTTLYPLLPDESRQQLENQRENLKLAQKDYESKVQKEKINWVKDYLELVNSHQRLEIQKEYLSFARQNLEQVEKQKEIGEAGTGQLLEAQIEKKDAEISYQEQKNLWARNKDDWYQTLGLPEEREVDFSAEDPYLEEIRSRVDERDLTAEQEKKELQENLLQTNQQLARLDQEQHRAAYNLDKRKKETGPKVDFSGDYNLPDGDWQASISLSYNLFDGGLEKLDIKEAEKEVEDIKEDYRKLENDLIKQLENMLTSLKTKQEKKELSKLRLEKSKMDTAEQQKKLDQGLITELEYRQQIVDKKDTEINLQSAENNILLQKLDILNFTGEEIFK